MDDKTSLPFLTQWTISPVPWRALVTVVETPEFLAATRKLMDARERGLLVDHLALNPMAGDVIPGTGGVRKLRWGLEGRGKRGGARVIYFYDSAGIPLFALTAYAKKRAGGPQRGGPQRVPATDQAAGGELHMAKQTNTVADSIRRGLEQAVAYASGEADRSAYGVHVPEDIDVRAIRMRLGMTQDEFAGRFGFSVNTLRHWEQGKRQPEGPTRAYLLVIDRAPKAVQKALRVA
jgi:putative transcriptional regulator